MSWQTRKGRLISVYMNDLVWFSFSSNLDPLYVKKKSAVFPSLLALILSVMSVGTFHQCGIFAFVWRDEDHNFNITSFKLEAVCRKQDNKGKEASWMSSVRSLQCASQSSPRQGVLVLL